MNPVEQQFSSDNENTSKPLSINITVASPIDNTSDSENEEESDIECSTPNKGLNSSNESTKPTVKSGLLTYSTPLAPTVIQKRPPRVNFHSIDDIVNGGGSSHSSSTSISSPSTNNDSGISSFIYNSSLSSPFFNSQPSQIYNKIALNSSSNVQNGSFSDDLDDKENDESNKKSCQIDANNANGKKVVRTTFSDQQKRALDIYFNKNPYPDPSETQELSEQLALPENVIKVWFQNKRSRDKQRKFSHSNRMLNKLAVIKNNNVSQAITSSPISSTNGSSNASFAQLLQSKFSTYAAMAAVVNAVQQNNQSSNFYHNFLNQN